jgi:N-acetylglucosaminyl-diphospho-decaprenol L-rhamnosyltransferase
MIEKAPEISLVITSYNSRRALAQSLEGLFQPAACRRTFEVLVVDDASWDGSPEMVAEQFPQVRLFANPQNIGYARSCNRGIAEARGRLIHLLNNDARPRPGALDCLADFLDAHPAVGAAGSLLLDEDGSTQVSAKALPSMRSALFGGRSWLSKWMPSNRFSRAELQHWRAEAGEPFTTGYVSFASMMTSRNVIDEIGPVDEQLFNFTDADFCKRVWDSGREVMSVPQAQTVHLNHRGGSRRDARRRMSLLFDFHKCAWTYSRKHSKQPAWHPQQLFVLAALGVRLAVTTTLQVAREVLGIDRRAYGGH